MIWVLATNSNVLIPISLQPDVVSLWFLKLWILSDSFSKSEILKVKPSGCKNM